MLDVLKELRAGRRSAGFTLVQSAFRESPAWSGLMFAVMAAASLLPSALAVLSGVLVVSLPKAFGEGRTDAGRADLVGAVVGMGVLLLLQETLPPVALALAERVGRRLDAAAADRVVAALGRPATAAEIEVPAVRDRLQGINGGLGVASVRDALEGYVNIGIVRLGALSGVLLVIVYRWWVGLLVAIAYVVTMSMLSQLYRIGLNASEGNPATARRAQYVRELASSPATAKDVRVFGLTPWLRRRYRQEWLEGLRLARQERSHVWWVSLLATALIVAAQLLVLLQLVSDVTSGRLSIGFFTVLVVVVVGLSGVLTLGPEVLNIAVGGSKLAAIDQLEETVRRPGPLGGGKVAASRRPPTPELTREVVFEGVWFGYRGGGEPVLRDLDLSIAAGRSTALVGVNGAGKTTLIKLMCGLYRPDRGRILVDGVDLATVDLAEWQRRCALLSQHWLRWGLSARENVLWAGPDQPVDERAFRAAVATAGLDEVVARLPQTWDTPLSRQFGGVDLSGGQWQRVGLARALYARALGARVLVMDEPTSALDVRGEAEVNERLLAATDGQTVVLVSHRFATVRRATQIVVLADGRVLEQGDHDSLLAAGDAYAAMFTAQARRFSDEPDETDDEVELA